MAAAENTYGFDGVVDGGPSLDNESTLTYLKVTTKIMRVGPIKIKSNASTSKRELKDTLRMVATQHSESSKFAMQNHIAAEVSGGWWKVNASHDHQYETNSHDAKQNKNSERALLDAFESMSLDETYELGAGDVYVESVAIKCHKFTVKGKEDKVHCIHYPAQTASIVGPVNRESVLSYAKMYFLDFESWRPVFAALHMHDVAHKVGFDRSQLRKMLKTKVYNPPYNPIYLKSHPTWVLGAEDGNINSGANLILCEYHGGDNQLWKYDGTYIRWKQDPNFVVDVESGSIKCGTNIHVTFENGWQELNTS